MASMRLVNKGEAEVLADLQALCPNISGFSWDGSIPVVTGEDCTERNKSVIGSYFCALGSKKWVAE